MENSNQSAEDSENRLRQLALDMIDQKVFTSRHLWFMCEDPEEWLECMKKVFNASNLAERIPEIAKALTSESFAGILYWQYNYLNKNDNKSELPKFETCNMIYGDELKKLDQELKDALRVRVH